MGAVECGADSGVLRCVDKGAGLSRMATVQHSKLWRGFAADDRGGRPTTASQGGGYSERLAGALPPMTLSRGAGGFGGTHPSAFTRPLSVLQDSLRGPRFSAHKVVETLI